MVLIYHGAAATRTRRIASTSPPPEISHAANPIWRCLHPIRVNRWCARADAPIKIFGARQQRGKRVHQAVLDAVGVDGGPAGQLAKGLAASHNTGCHLAPPF